MKITVMKYIAMNSCGEVWKYETKPKFVVDSWEQREHEHDCDRYHDLNVEKYLGQFKPEESLHEILADGTLVKV